MHLHLNRSLYEYIRTAANEKVFYAYCTVRKTLKGPMAREKYGACGVDFSLNSGARILFYIFRSSLTECGKNIKPVRGPLLRPKVTHHILTCQTFLVTRSL